MQNPEQNVSAAYETHNGIHYPLFAGGYLCRCAGGHVSSLVTVPPEPARRSGPNTDRAPLTVTGLAAQHQPGIGGAEVLSAAIARKGDEGLHTGAVSQNNFRSLAQISYPYTKQTSYTPMVRQTPSGP